MMAGCSLFLGLGLILKMNYFAILVCVVVAWFAVALGDRIKVHSAKREFVDNYNR